MPILLIFDDFRRVMVCFAAGAPQELRFYFSFLIFVTPFWQGIVCTKSLIERADKRKKIWKLNLKKTEIKLIIVAYLCLGFSNAAAWTSLSVLPFGFK